MERKTPRLRRRLVSLAKKPSTALSQEAEVGVKWNVKRGWRASQAAPWVLVDGVVVEDGVDDLAGRDLRLDGVEEADELLMPVALHAAADDLAFEHVERREQGRGAVALIIVGHGAAAAWLQRQARLGAVERLDLPLLVDAEHDRMRRRIDVEADDVAQLGDELGVVRQLELAHPVRLQAVARQMRCTELTLMPAASAIAAPVQWVASPGGSPWSARPRARHAAERRNARRPRLVAQQAVHAFVGMKRSCQRHTQVLVLPVWRMISLVPKPPALNSTICARHTCF